MAISSFIASISGMDAQSHAMGQVSTNIANVTTVGYKPTETMFYTMLGSEPAVKSNSVNMDSTVRADVNGVGYYDRTHVELKGDIAQTGNNFDVALDATNAFFVVEDDYGQDFYTKAGNFGMSHEDGNTYLTSGTGLKVQGYQYLGEAGFSAAYEDIIVNIKEEMPSTPTSELTITANVPASDVESSAYSMTFYGPNNDGETVTMLWTKATDQLNAWDVSFSTAEGSVTTPPQRVNFGADGTDPVPTSLDVALDWNESAGGGSNSVSVDISTMTQFAGSSGIVTTRQDGAESGTLTNAYIDESGIIQAQYSNKKTTPIAQIAVVGFGAPGNLISETGTLFSATQAAGEIYNINTGGLDSIIRTQALEQSAVNVEEEFSKLVVVQQAYSMNTQSFTVNNEMIQNVVDLKS